MITICPSCSKSQEVSDTRKNNRILCEACKEFFMAYEAKTCSSCGKFKHPNHRCKCGKSDKVFQLAGSSPEIETLVVGLPDEVQNQLEKIFSAIKERIEDLENKVSDLEDEIEELRKNQDI